ncbi:BbrUII/HgiDII family restriction enzyme [Micropruina glycogenica]|uniref:Histidine kinase-, DNA gyrase B-, and HSP90-like ATPase n=1 Tax=Micropruina glycogenica TaxID=75385 RepID=A0A2N9JF19_9ACTN|nr:ATP-binding protein [Micropruina glycogenica]SPD85976.1 Histidine kinase-, DNA gyrase B-, and HSP90-like ATPase [Micropruina glycogenica]
MGKYKMSVGLSVLDSLGINLYSNAAAVLSELVANAYDADATSVDIEWKQGESVLVRDDGNGMSVDDMNNRFLMVGYRKRDEANEGHVSPRFGRAFMGRKGIGKLSVFSIADVVTVYSTKDGETNAFRIDADDLKARINSGHEYEPQEVTEVPEGYDSQGTVLELTSLRTKRADLTATALRKRLARRFDVLDQTPPTEGGFSIVINGNRLNWLDRQELKSLQFIWEFGDDKIPDSALPHNVARFPLNGVIDEAREWFVRGWFGTAKQPTDLTRDEEAGSLKNIIVLARKRPIQEGIIEKLDFSRVFGNYVTGQIEADFLDDDALEDIATSDRQRLIEDDERVVALRDFLRKAFVSASETWSNHRPKKEVLDVLTRYPKLQEWVDGLAEYQRDSAKAMLGTIASLDFESGSEGHRKDLFRSGILAFARVGLRKATAELDSLSRMTAEDLLALLGRQAEYEAGLWVDILRSRIEAIDQFQNLSDANEKEKVLQRHLFEHLWLLDASWERAAGSQRIEQSLKKVARDDFGLGADEMEERGRIDIRYATTGGKHIIVELKRYNVKPDIDDLRNQGGRYAVALKEVLVKEGNSNPDIEVVFVIGEFPKVVTKTLMTDGEYTNSLLAQINGRIVYYDQLIANALKQYEEYLDASEDARNLDALLDSITAQPGAASSEDGGPADK